MIKKIIIFIITLVFTFTILLIGCTSEVKAGFQESKKANDKEIQSKLIKYIDEYSKKNGFSGTILVAKGDDVLLNRGYGMADYDKKITNTSQTVFEIGSVTKQFTATAILMLQEQKKISVQDPISKYISDYPNGNKIKIYNLLTHTSGIPEYTNFIKSMKSGKHTYTPEELIGLFRNERLCFEPGTSFQYSNSNYILLGYIIEKISKMKYEDYIEKNILKPLKMNQTGFLRNQNNIKEKAVGYFNIDEKSNTNMEAYKVEESLPYAAGEIYSTDEDLYRWEKALFSGKIISKESLNEMFTPNLDNYGYGWFINKHSEGDKSIFHSGSIPGYTSYIERNIDNKFAIIILSNKDTDDSVNDIALGVSKILKTT